MRLKISFYHELWKSRNAWIDHYLRRLSDEDLRHESLPGKHHGIWQLGHLIASDDDLSLYLGRGGLLYPGYQDFFGQGSQVRPAGEYPDAQTLRKAWRAVCAKNDAMFAGLNDSILDEPHAKLEGAMEDDYFKTKEGCIKNWLLHNVHHCGQLAMLRSGPA